MNLPSPPGRATSGLSVWFGTSAADLDSFGTMTTRLQPKTLDVLGDTDLAGCLRTRRSTSGGVATLGSHAVKSLVDHSEYCRHEFR